MTEATAWITGVGVAGPHGANWPALMAAMADPQPHFSPMPEDWAGLPGAAAGFIARLHPAAEAGLAPFDTASTDRSCALAMYTAQEAWQQAAPSFEPRRAGVYWGTGMGGLHTTETSYNRLLVAQAPLRPTTVVRIMANSAAAQLAIKYGLQGPNNTYSVACASSATALGEALFALRSGRIDLALVGGSEALLVPGVMAAWNALRVLSTRKTAKLPTLPCRPFSSERSGLVIGEGAAAFVLESPRHARARGARPLAALTGCGSTCDAASLVHPQAAGQVHAMQDALRDAGLAPGEIDAVNAHATATDAGDVAEATALLEVFSGRPPPVSATKSMHGHLLGAAGAMEAAVCLASLAGQVVPATLGAEPVDPRCAGLSLSAVPRPARIRRILSNSFAFGGANVSLVFEQVHA
ncbi:MAG: beta-ketoacyl-[acyl-carrier-protein] synthase family protein [Burkholderiales bacterium]|nr:beta-ketoacyl-[acyl-carrier-protein] synthase family protein [Burkholderiales bacterium]